MNVNFENRTVGLTSSDSNSQAMVTGQYADMDWFVVRSSLVLSF